ncbi:MAG TPA: tetratricopeptide repeat protein [Bacteroidales bacterium]|nr:tetratricopeptide repeat protein [Bacteroidales bacterium]
MKKLATTIILTLISIIHVFSQEIYLDSVLSAVHEKHDTIKIDTLVKCYRFYERGNIQAGKIFLDKSLSIANNLGNAKWMGKVLLKMGNFYSITGEYEIAITYFTDAIDYFNTINNYQGIGSAYNNLGATYEKMGRYNDAMDNLIKALNTYELNADSLSIAKTYLNLGLLYASQEDYEKSLELYNKSLKIREKLNDSAGIALVYNNMAIVNYALGDYENVQSYFEKAYHIYLKTGNLRRQLMALSNLGEIYNIIGQRDKALKTYFEVLELEKKLGQKGEMVKTYFMIADLYNTRENTEKAQFYAYQSLDLALEIGALADLVDIYGFLSSLFKEQGNYHKALNYHELFHTYSDSIFNAEKSRQIKELETQYETRKKEQIIKNLENENIINDLRIKRQQYFLFSFIAGFLSIAIFLIILFRQNSKIRAANTELAYQKKQITDSIEYASRIQRAILPPSEYISGLLPEHFILYKPRDIVSGDFYWITHKEEKIVLAVVDCTGHGVPGAFMSMLGFAFLNEIVNKEKDIQANLILNQLRRYVKDSLHQTGKENEAKDGMDIALCVIDPLNLTIQFSGAYNPLYIVRKNNLETIKADRMPIGIHIVEKESFTNHLIQADKGDTIYLFTDGYIDQFGGKKSQKFKMAPFQELLFTIKDMPMDEQKRMLEKHFEDWKGSNPQIDDVLIMGIKL